MLTVLGTCSAASSRPTIAARSVAVLASPAFSNRESQNPSTSRESE